MLNNGKVVIIGCGSVGATIAYTLMLNGIFKEIVLIDTDMSRAQGEAMDISHGIPFSRPMTIHAGTYDEVEDAGMIIITAGGNQKYGETRLDLVERNVGILRQILPQIMKYNFAGKLLIVSNPVDVLTYVAWKITGLPRESVIGSGTVLDSARLKYLIGRRIGVDSRSVHAFIIGEHGDTEIAVWSKANVSGIPLRLFLDMSGMGAAVEAEVKGSAYEIINKKKATYYGIGMAVNKICDVIVRDEHSLLPVSTVLNGEYDIENVALSLPCIVGKDGVQKYVPIQLNVDEYDALLESAMVIRQVLRGIGF